MGIPPKWGGGGIKGPWFGRSVDCLAHKVTGNTVFLEEKWGLFNSEIRPDPDGVEPRNKMDAPPGDAGRLGPKQYGLDMAKIPEL